MRKLHCEGCGRVAAILVDGSVSKGMKVRCAKCEAELQTRLTSLAYLNTTRGAVKPANLDGIFGDLFNKK